MCNRRHVRIVPQRPMSNLFPSRRIAAAGSRRGADPPCATPFDAGRGWLQRILIMALGLCAMAANAGGPNLEIESLVPTQVWATSTADLVIAGTLRNRGSEVLPPGAGRIRFFALSGLDYVSGDTSPKLPALSPGQSVTFVWRVRPVSSDARLAVALSLEQPNAPPTIRMIAIPHLQNPVTEDPVLVANACRARVNGLDATVENDRVRLRLLGGSLAVVSCRSGGGWRLVGAVFPLIRCVSAERGEVPWCETFQPETASTFTTKDTAGLLLRGSIGTKWRATLRFAVRKGSSAIDEHLWLAAQKTLEVQSICFSPFHAGAGSFGMAASEAIPCSASGSNMVAACRWGEITCGIVIQGNPPIQGWQSKPLDPVPGAEYRTMGNRWDAVNAPTMVPRAGLVEISARLFALQPSTTVQDAMKVSLPRLAVEPALHEHAAAVRSRGVHAAAVGGALRGRN